MTRNEEYAALLAELSRTPPALAGTADRALARQAASRRKRRAWGISCGSLAACFAAFVVLVNCVPTFALACERIPVLGALAEAVAWNRSLSAAVEHDYVQPIGQSQMENGVTAAVEYVIVDRKQVSIFFTLSSADAERLDFDYDITLPGDPMGYFISTGSFGLGNGELRQIDLSCGEELEVPGSLTLDLRVYDSAAGTDAPTGDSPEQRDYLAAFTFHLTFDPWFTAQGEVLPVDTAFTVGGQTLTLREVELYPTHLRVRVDADPDNTAWLMGLDLYLENERGERFQSGGNGITASGDTEGEGYGTFWLESPFFSESQHLTLTVAGVRWLDKDQPPVRVDLAVGTAEGLAEGVRFLGAEREGTGWRLSFSAPRETDGGMYQLFDAQARDEAGEVLEISSWSQTMGERTGGETRDEDTRFTTSFPVEDFDGTVLLLAPLYSREQTLAVPVTVSIK